MNIMKKLLTIFLLPFLFFWCLTSFATNYYVSASGSDANNGTTTSTTWKTLSRVNAATFSPGDQILFKRGDIFYGELLINQSGSTGGNPIIFGAYGSGASPMITGFTNVTSWTEISTNIWESSNAASSLSTCNVVVINGKNTPMGRYPNTGYLTFQSHVNNTSITCSSLTGTPDWTGADAAIRVNHWTVNRVTINSQAGGTLNFDAVSGDVRDNFGFFIENDVRTLDAQNEWYFNPSTKKIRVYSESEPTNVMVASVDTVIYVKSSRNYINFDSISVQGANQILMYEGGNYANILNCSFSFCGWDGLQMAGSYNTISNDTLTDIGGNGVFLHFERSGHNFVTSNVFRRTNLITGVLKNDYTAAAIRCYSPNSLIQYNDIDSSGYNGIQLRYQNVEIRNNLINHSCLIRDDGGGIYTGFTGEVGKIIDGNIILNSEGNYYGTNITTGTANGIYIDDNGNNVSITNNSVYNCSGAGLFLHGANTITARNNTIYNNGGAGFTRGGLYLQTSPRDNPMRNNIVNNNILFSRDSAQYSIFSNDNISTADSKLIVTTDSNFYCKPITFDANVIRVYGYGDNSLNNYNLAQWKAYMGGSMDAHSKGSPKSISDVNDLRFEYNATSWVKTIHLDSKYIDVKGNEYNDSITLAPYTSAILIKE